MNGHLYNLLEEHGLEHVVKHREVTLQEVIDLYLDKLLNNEIEGIVINFGEEILKWKGMDESYPDMYLDEITALESKIRPEVFHAFMKVATKAREERVSLKKDKATEILLEKAYKSAMSKMRSLEEQVGDGGTTDEVVVKFQKMLGEEMMKDSHCNDEYEQKLTSFIESKINKR